MSTFLFRIFVLSFYILNSALTDCLYTPCRHEQLVCPEGGNCIIHCNDSRPYACDQTDVACPSGRGDCTVNCNDLYACRQASWACSYLNALCSGENCLINCEHRYSCPWSNITCESGNCIMNCNGWCSCWHSTVICPPGRHCTINCASHSWHACQRATLLVLKEETASSPLMDYTVVTIHWQECNYHMSREQHL